MRRYSTPTLVFGIFFALYLTASLNTIVAHDLFGSVARYLAISWLAGLAVMVALFALAVRKDRYDYVDAGWGLSFVAIALAGLGLNFWNGDASLVQRVVVILVGVWGLRLASHIWKRLRRSSEEDHRYVELRSRWKRVTKGAIFVRIYVIQSVLALLVSIPVVHILRVDNPVWSTWTTIGLVVWLFGFIWEVVGDQQLARFVRDPKNKGQLMKSGLWAYSRHPNYFGEIIMWWGIAIICLGTPYGWVGTGGAAVITYLIMYVSGVPLAEKRSSTKPGWKAYAQKTPKLVPFSS